MKKIYNAPSITVVHIAQQLLEGGSYLQKYSGESVTDEGDVLSRERSGSLWDDEE